MSDIRMVVRKPNWISSGIQMTFEYQTIWQLGNLQPQSGIPILNISKVFKQNFFF